MKRRDLVAGAGGALLFARYGKIGAQTPEVAGYSHPEWFAEPEWLVDQLGRQELSIVALTPEDDFSAGHIPGASQIDWPALEVVETDEASLETWQGEAESLVTGLGISRGDTVVVYDGGTFWAARLWWILHYLGHENVRILNGGLQAWNASGGELETGSNTVEEAAGPYSGTANMDVIVTINQAVAELEAGDSVFVDARSQGEFADGHIPGAVNVPFIDNAVGGDLKSWKSPADLLAMYEAAGVSPNQRAIPYCSSGVRSATTYFTLRQIGFENVALFTGSFAEWTADSNRPVETAT